MYQRAKIFTALIAATLLTQPMVVLAGKMYRWVDDQGRVYYSDVVPPAHSGKARSRMSERGIELEKIEAAKTREQIEKDEELKRLRAEQQRLIEEQRAKDRVLLRTFRSDDDILMTRDGKLAYIDSLIQIIRSNIRRLKLKLEEMQKHAANLERQGQSISRNYFRDIENTRQQLKDSYADIIHKEQSKEQIRRKYALDLARFRALKNLNPEQGIVAEQRKRRSLLETVVICDSEPNCSAAWEKAEVYVRNHATTRLQMLAESIIMTAAPGQDSDISITVSRITEQGEPGAKLFMDLQCKESPLGRDFCDTDQVDEIRSGFRAFLGYKGVVSEEKEPAPEVPTVTPTGPGGKP